MSGPSSSIQFDSSLVKKPGSFGKADLPTGTFNKWLAKSTATKKATEREQANSDKAQAEHDLRLSRAREVGLATASGREFAKLAAHQVKTGINTNAMRDREQARTEGHVARTEATTAGRVREMRVRGAQARNMVRTKSRMASEVEGAKAVTTAVSNAGKTGLVKAQTGLEKARTERIKAAAKAKPVPRLTQPVKNTAPKPVNPASRQPKKLK